MCVCVCLCVCVCIYIQIDRKTDRQMIREESFLKSFAFFLYKFHYMKTAHV